MRDWRMKLLTENMSNTSSGKRSADTSNPSQKDSAWAVVCEWMTAWALAGLPSGGVTPVQAAGTFGGGGIATTEGIQVNWDVICGGSLASAVKRDNTGTRRRNTDVGMEGSMTNKSGIEQVPATSPFTQAELDALGQAIKVETDKLVKEVDGMPGALGPANVFVTDNDRGHTDILVLTAEGIPLAGFHNKNNAHSRGDNRDIGMSNASFSALAGSQLDGAKEYLESITDWMEQQYTSIPQSKRRDIIQTIQGPQTSSGTDFVLQRTIKDVTTVGGRGYAGRISRNVFVQLYNSTPGMRTKFGKYIEDRLTIVPQFKIITDCGKKNFVTWTVSSEKYEVDNYLWEKGIASASSSNQSEVFVDIPTTPSGTKRIVATLRSDGRATQLKFENKNMSKYQILAEEIAEMKELDGGEELPPDMEAALVDELIKAIGPVPAELLGETDDNDGGTINESRWLKLAGLLND